MDIVVCAYPNYLPDSLFSAYLLIKTLLYAKARVRLYN